MGQGGSRKILQLFCQTSKSLRVFFIARVCVRRLAENYLKPPEPTEAPVRNGCKKNVIIFIEFAVRTYLRRETVLFPNDISLILYPGEVGLEALVRPAGKKLFLHSPVIVGHGAEHLTN